MKKNKPGAAKEIQKLTAALAEKKKQSEKLRHEALGNRTKCPILNKLKAERKACSKCQEQQKRKYRAKVENPLQKVCLIDKGKNPEVYLLTNTNVCWYNKKDLTSFLEGSGKSKRMLRDEKREITDLKVYSSF